METQIITNRTNTFNFDELNAKTSISDRKYSNMDIAKLFADRQGTYLNEFNFFLLYFNRIPNFIHEIEIDCEKANLWFANNYKNEIKDWYYDKRYLRGSKKAKFDDVFYMLDKDLMVNFDTNQSIVRFLFRETDIKAVELIIKGIKKFKKRKERSKPEILLLVNTKLGIGTEVVKIIRPKLNIEDNYNDDFKQIHETIIKRLSKKNDKGSTIISGECCQ